MPRKTTPRASSSDATLQTVAWLAKEGIKSVLLRPQSKAAVSNGFEKPDYVPPDISAWKKADHGVAAVLGIEGATDPERGGLADIDLDCSEATVAAPKLFPPTPAVFGRATNRASHLEYRVAASAYLKLDDPMLRGKEATIIEVRAGGRQYTVMPGSRHEETGEVIVWEGVPFPPLPDADVGQLLDDARMTGVAVLIARHCWHEGNRNYVNMDLAGIFFRCGWSEEKAEQVIQVVMDLCGDDDATRIKTLRNTFRKAAAGKKVTGATALKKRLGEKLAPVVDRIQEWARGPDGGLFPDVTKEGYPRPTLRNTLVAMEQLGVECSFDRFKLKHYVSGTEITDFAGELADAAIHRLRELVIQKFRFDPGKETVKDSIYTLTNHSRFHPVLEHLASLPKWDKVPRIDTWLIDCAGAEDTDYVRAVSRIFLLAAVRRVRLPGCKFDTMLTLQGEQGTGKSSALAILAGNPDWFSDQLSFNAKDKEVIEQLAGYWIIEVAELKGMRTTELEHRKAFLSRQRDRGRLAYAMTVSDVPRQCVFAGTTNEERFLRDHTGHRRDWPVQIEKFDLERLRRDRDQLWAEAAEREAAGESIQLDPALWEAAAEQQRLREVENPFVSTLMDKLGNLEGRISSETVWALLNVRPANRHQLLFEQRGAAMKELGWERRRLRTDGGRDYFYIKGEEPYRVIIAFGDGNEVVARHDNPAKPKTMATNPDGSSDFTRKPDGSPRF